MNSVTLDRESDAVSKVDSMLSQIIHIKKLVRMASRSRCSLILKQNDQMEAKGTESSCSCHVLSEHLGIYEPVSFSARALKGLVPTDSHARDWSLRRPQGKRRRREINVFRYEECSYFS